MPAAFLRGARLPRIKAMARAGLAYRADPTPERLAAYVRSIETVASDQRELVAFVVAVDPADALAEFEREVEGSQPRG